MSENEQYWERKIAYLIVVFFCRIVQHFLKKKQKPINYFIHRQFCPNSSLGFRKSGREKIAEKQPKNLCKNIFSSQKSSREAPSKLWIFKIQEGMLCTYVVLEHWEKRCGISLECLRYFLIRFPNPSGQRSTYVRAENGRNFQTLLISQLRGIIWDLFCTGTAELARSLFYSVSYVVWERRVTDFEAPKLWKDLWRHRFAAVCTKETTFERADFTLFSC